MAHHGVEEVLEHRRVEHGEDLGVLLGAPPLVPRPALLRFFGRAAAAAAAVGVGRVVARLQDGLMLLRNLVSVFKSVIESKRLCMFWVLEHKNKYKWNGFPLESHTGPHLNWFGDPAAPCGPAGECGRVRRRCRRHRRRRVRRVVLLRAGAVARRTIESGRDLLARLCRAPAICTVTVPDETVTVTV